MEMQVFSFFFKYVRGSGSPFRLALEIFKGRGASYSDSSTADDVHEMEKKKPDGIVARLEIRPRPLEQWNSQAFWGPSVPDYSR